MPRLPPLFGFVPMHHTRFILSSCLPLVWLCAASVQAQTPPPATDSVDVPKPAPVQRVDVTGARQADVDLRRQSTAAKIIVGRDEIERFGDASLGDLIKRLPGVTLDGRPGRGGNIRMRGLGGGYTQILLDGERVQGGLSLDAIDPEQIERIEILRAPTAETGARAIAGTINIITREGFRKRLNDLKLGASVDAGRLSENIAWTREDKIGEALNLNVSLSAFEQRRADASQTTTQSDLLDQREAATASNTRHGLHATGRLQWRLDEGETLMLMPLFIASQGQGLRDAQLVSLRTPAEPVAFAGSHTDSNSRFELARLNGQWKRTLLGGARMEVGAGLGRSSSRGMSVRAQVDPQGEALPTLEDSSRATESTAQLKAKLSTLLDGDHSLVGGLELDAARREDTRTSLRGGQAQTADDGSTFQAATRRVAAYTQDEWNLNPQWAAHAGLRWEGIETRGEGGVAATPTNRSSVLTPLLHAVWKPDPKGRDQVRMSLTRSYRSPSLPDLLGRPAISPLYPVTGGNTATSPDRAGNPTLRPELATGLDLAFEHYLPGSGLLSANVFHRRITDLMRTVTTLETVSWSSVPRWVARPQNIGGGITQGIELEAKFRLADVLDDAPAVDLRANASVFRSRVDSVAGPNNRLDQQPSGTANLGADYKLPAWPLTLGGNLNWTPSYTTRLSETQWLVQGRKQIVEAYALWQLSPVARLRLTASNLAPEDALNTSLVSGESASTVAQTYTSWRLQLELKL